MIPDTTPAQSYAQRLIDAINNLVDNPTSIDWQDQVMAIAIERPETLRAAMKAYLYKSQSDQQNRKYYINRKKAIA